ncbi:MAG: hypothetical protein ACLPWD_02780 [Methanobacterium sp.]
MNIEIKERLANLINNYTNGYLNYSEFEEGLEQIHSLKVNLVYKNDLQQYQEVLSEEKVEEKS